MQSELVVASAVRANTGGLPVRAVAKRATGKPHARVRTRKLTLRPVSAPGALRCSVKVFVRISQ